MFDPPAPACEGMRATAADRKTRPSGGIQDAPQNLPITTNESDCHGRRARRFSGAELPRLFQTRELNRGHPLPLFMVEGYQEEAI